MSGLLVRLRALFRRGASEAELDEELRYHLERDAERGRAGFGSVGNIKEEVRDSWGLGWIEQITQDARFAWRSFRRAPTFALTVIGTIAIALGLNTTVFTVFDAYVLRPVAVRDPYSLYQLGYKDRSGEFNAFTLDEFNTLQRQDGITEAFAFQPIFAHRDDQPFLGALVSGNYFQMLGGSASLGRVLGEEDAAVRGQGAVIVLSHQAWHTTFGSDSAIVGKTIMVRGVPFQVVGVTAPAFSGISAVTPDFWAPASMAVRLRRAADNVASKDELFRIVIRLLPDDNERRATDRMTAWERTAFAGRPDTLPVQSATLHSVAAMVPLSPEIMVIAAPIMIAFGLVMLIACANVANMMLARGLARQREIGIRLALGAARHRLVRQLLTEAALLAIPAAALGFALSRVTISAATRLLIATVPSEFTSYMRITPLLPDARIFLFLLAAALGAALLFGLVPALQATRPDVVKASRGDFDTAGRANRLRGGLVLAQIVTCVLLLVTTGVLLRGAERAQRAETGMSTGGVVQLLIGERQRDAVIARLAADTTISALAATSGSPIDGELPWVRLARRTPNGTNWTHYDFVTPTYFDFFHVRIEQGRGFTDADARAGSAVVIVSRSLADGLWPGRDPIGHTLELTTALAPGSPLVPLRTAQVIGVAANTVTGWVGTGLESPLAYYPTSMQTAGTRLYVRVPGDAATERSRITKMLEETAPGSVEESHTAADLLAVQIYPFRAFYWVSASIGVIALLLTLTGIYGVMSYLVAQRTREIGIRMALGAGARSVLRLVLGQSVTLAAAGIAAGLLLAFGISLLMASQLYLIDARDPLGYAIGALVVMVACIGAAWVPSRRATRVDPVIALRSD